MVVDFVQVLTDCVSILSEVRISHNLQVWPGVEIVRLRRDKKVRKNPLGELDGELTRNV